MKLASKRLVHFRCNFSRTTLWRQLSFTPNHLVDHDVNHNLEFRGKGEARQADRDLLLDVLSSSATKRDAKSFLSRYQAKAKAKAAAASLSSEKQVPAPALHNRAAVSPNEVNLGKLFSESRHHPTGVSSELLTQAVPAQESNLRAAVIIVRSTSSIDDSTLIGIGHTIAQLSRLGLGCIVIVDDDLPSEPGAISALNHQLERLVDSIETDGTVRSQRLNRLFQSDGLQGPWAKGVKLIDFRRVYDALRHESVIVAAPVVYGSSGDVVDLNANGAALSLSYELQHANPADLAAGQHENGTVDTSPAITLDRVIVIDPRGGLPKISQGGSHVFVNLEQEFESISNGLQTLLQEKERFDGAKASSSLRTTSTCDESSLGEGRISAAAATLSSNDIQAHLANLRLTRGILSSLPSTSSSLIVTPAAASYSTNLPVQGVGTRSKRNPLIHNLLTDKPLFSSSLPRGRLSALDTDDIPTNHPSMIDAPPTHLKHGMPLVIVPDPSSKAWKAPDEATFSLSLEDPRIDVERLVALIEDSFGRPLDREAYFARIRPRLAGIIVAGNYEGGAILTWEQPNSFHQQDAALGSDKSEHLVPYLDKFAVLRQAQGGGVADVVFSAMVRRCFPKGVCWRSRNGNPVNKWYFERSRGAYKLPVEAAGDQAWTMFWTTEGLQGARFAEYAEVCRAVKSSWADNKKPMD